MCACDNFIGRTTIINTATHCEANYSRPYSAHLQPPILLMRFVYITWPTHPECRRLPRRCPCAPQQRWERWDGMQHYHWFRIGSCNQNAINERHGDSSSYALSSVLCTCVICFFKPPRANIFLLHSCKTTRPLQGVGLRARTEQS